MKNRDAPPISLDTAINDRLKLQTDLIVSLIVENEGLRRELNLSKQANQVLFNDVQQKN